MLPHSPSLSSPNARTEGWYPAMEQLSIVEHSPMSTPELQSPGLSSVTTDKSEERMQRTASSAKRRASKELNSEQTSCAAFRCQDFPEEFVKKSNRNDHHRTHDGHKARVRCGERGCHKDFGRQADLARHKRSVGSSRQPSCYQADQSQNHRGDKHACRYCNKCFNRSDIMRR